MEGLEQFFNDNDKGYLRDPRRMAYAKLRKNVQGMDREQLEAFIKANLFIPHSQYKMALGNLIQFLHHKMCKIKNQNPIYIHIFRNTLNYSNNSILSHRELTHFSNCIFSIGCQHCAACININTS